MVYNPFILCMFFLFFSVVFWHAMITKLFKSVLYSAIRRLPGSPESVPRYSKPRSTPEMATPPSRRPPSSPPSTPPPSTPPPANPYVTSPPPPMQRRRRRKWRPSPASRTWHRPLPSAEMPNRRETDVGCMIAFDAGNDAFSPKKKSPLALLEKKKTLLCLYAISL